METHRYGLIIPSKNKGARSAFFGGASSSEPKPKVFSNAADSSSDDNLEEDDEVEDPKQALDWRSRTVAVIISFNNTKRFKFLKYSTF